MSQGGTTTDHDVIREWAESRGGRPTRVRGTEGKDGSGVLRFDFAEPDEKLEEISWDEFFETFDDRELALLYQDKTADGHTSRFFKFIHRREGDDGGGEHRETHRAGDGSHASTRHGEKHGRSEHGEKESAMAKDTHRSGSVKDPEHDGRLKENREAGRTKGTTSGSEARAHEHGNEPEHGRGGSHSGGSHSKASESSGSHSKASESGGSHAKASESGGSHGKASESGKQSSGGDGDNLKSREYKDAQGNIHHHTRTYQEQHGKE